MEAKGYNCVKCGKSIFQKDIKRKQAGFINDKPYCKEHYKEILRRAALKTNFIDEHGNEVEPEI